MSQVELKLRLNRIQKQERINYAKREVSDNVNNLLSKTIGKLKDVKVALKLAMLIESTVISYHGFSLMDIGLFGSIFTFAVMCVILFNNNIIPTKDELIKLK